MNYIKVTTTYPTGGTLLPNAFVDNYMIRANGEYIKVYIYLLRMVSDGANFSIPCLADVLELTERDVTRALKYWEKESLLRMELKDGEISFIELLPVSGNPHSPAQTTKQEDTAQATSSAASATISSPWFASITASAILETISLTALIASSLPGIT